MPPRLCAAMEVRMWIVRYKHQGWVYEKEYHYFERAMEACQRFPKSELHWRKRV